MAGKGDRKRPLGPEFDENYIKIFGKECEGCNGSGERKIWNDGIENDVPCTECNGLGKVEK